MLKGLVITDLGYEYTRYTSCIDLNNITYYYQKYGDNNIYSVKLKDYNSDELSLIKL